MTHEQWVTVGTIVFAFLVAGGIIGMLAFAVIRDHAEMEKIERDAIARRIEAMRRTRGRILHLRQTAARVP